jgi:hypothetical protein
MWILKKPNPPIIIRIYGVSTLCSAIPHTVLNNRLSDTTRSGFFNKDGLQEYLYLGSVVQNTLD